MRPGSCAACRRREDGGGGLGRIDDVALKELKPYMIGEHLSRLRKEDGRNGGPLSGATVQHAFSFLKTALKRAVLLEYIPSNPCDRVRSPKRDAFEAKPLTKEEVQKVMFLLIGHPSHQFSMACRLALATGAGGARTCESKEAKGRSGHRGSWNASDSNRFGAARASVVLATRLRLEPDPCRHRLRHQRRVC